MDKAKKKQDRLADSYMYSTCFNDVHCTCTLYMYIDIIIITRRLSFFLGKSLAALGICIRLALSCMCIHTVCDSMFMCVC